MRRVTLLVSMICLGASGVIGIVAGCGSDDPAAAPPDATASSSSSGGEAGASSSSSSSGSTVPEDSGNNTSSGNTPTSNPGQLTCGTATCDAGGGGGGNGVRCCARPNGGEATCTTANQCDDDGADAGLALRCDEKADCNDDNDVCCLFAFAGGGGGGGGGGGFGNNSTSCANACRFGNGGNARRVPQVCKTNEECGDAGACAQHECNGFKLFVCGLPEGCK